MNRRLTATLLTGLTIALLAACGAPEPVKETSRTPMGLTINPNVVKAGEVGTSYTFTLNATGLKGRSELATFKWSFSGGASGELEVAVENGAATLDVAQAFDAAGVYGLVASVDTGARAATASAVISIGEAAPEREAELTTCGDWVTKQQGAYGVTIDRWDVSSVPVGAVFDLKFDTVGIPDRILIEYPSGTYAHDTGWRGDAKHDGDALYPGGVVGGATGEARAIFTKGSENEFTATVFGPDVKTRWSYEVRCRVPGR